MTHLVIIGGGPAGIAAASEAARFSVQVTLIEADQLGGRATWHSLLPSKAWLSTADRMAGRPNAQKLGLTQDMPNYDFSTLLTRIAGIKRAMHQHYTGQLEAGGVRLVKGTASFEDAAHIRVEHEDGSETLTADRVLIATGSGPVFLPDVRPDGQRILAPRLMSKLSVIPDSLIMIGAGVTGSEFAYMFNMLGADVTLVTDIDELLPRSDRDISQALDDVFRAREMTIRYHSAVKSAAADAGGVVVTLHNGDTLRADMAFIAIGRKPHLDGLNIDAAGLQPDALGALVVDGFGRTAVEHIYAAGDVTGAPMTANKGMAQGYIAARHALGGQVAPFHPATVVEAVYTHPEVAQVGLTEAVAQQQGRLVTVIKRPYSGNLKAHLLGATEGMFKLLVDPETNALLGGAAIGPGAVDTVAPLAIALKYGARAEDLASIFAGHPSLGETLFDAARAV